MSWLGADKENLFILNFYHEETDEPDEWRKGKRKGFLVSVKPGKDFPDQGKKELISFNIIALADIEAVKPGNLVSSGFLGLKVKDKEMIVARYSNSQLQKFGLFTGLLEKLRKGEEITEEDVKKDEREMKCPKCGKLYPDPNRKVCPTCLDKKSLFLRVLSYAPRYWKQMTIVLIFMIVSSSTLSIYRR